MNTGYTEVVIVHMPNNQSQALAAAAATIIIVDRRSNQNIGDRAVTIFALSNSETERTTDDATTIIDGRPNRW